MKAHENYIFYDVTDKSLELVGILPLYELWEDDFNKYYTPLEYDYEVQRALTMNHKVCMAIGTLDNDRVIIRNGINSWMDCKKIVHEGFVYVKFNDLLHCEKKFK